jgi:hypothetical protein
VRAKSLQGRWGRGVRVSLAVASMTVLTVLAFGAAPASAGQTHVFEEVFGSAAQPTFVTAYSLEVHQASGDVIVLDASAKTIRRFKPNGEPDPFSALSTNVIDGAGPGADETPENGFTFSSALGEAQIAVDSSGGATDGNIYVTQQDAGLHLVDIFAPTGEYLGQLTGVSGGLFGSSSRPAGVAVGDDGTLFVSDFGEKKIYKYVPSANPPLNSDGQVFSTAVSDPGRLAIAGGQLFVSQRPGRVFRLASDGAIQCFVQDGANDQVGANPANDHLLVGNGSEISEYDAGEYDASNCTEAKFSSLEPIARFKATSKDIAVEASSGRLFLAAFQRVEVWSDLVPIPEPNVAAASNIGKTSAILNGAIETFGEELTECRFEYVAEADYDQEAENPYAAGETIPCAESFAEIGTGSAAVHANIFGLQPETRYHYRLVVANANGEDASEDEAFQTKSKPQLLGEWSEDVSVHEATLKAQINPQSADTTYRFEWGLTGPPYEHSTADIAIGSAATAHTVSLLLRGLTAGTTYHFRVSAENEMGASLGLDHTFVTFPPGAAPATDCPNQAFRIAEAALLPDCRAYEMVSPVDKNGGDIFNTLLGETPVLPQGYVQASLDGEKIAYSTAFYSFADEPNTFLTNQYLASRRAGEGWSSEGIHPPVAGGVIGVETPFGAQREFIAFSPDLCSAWLLDVQTPPPTADGQEGYKNLYRRQNCAPGVGELEALIPWPENDLAEEGTSQAYVDNNSVQGVSADSRHALFAVEAKLTDDARPAAPGAQLYDRFEGGLHLVSVLPDGSGGDPTSGNGEGFADPHPAAVGSGGAFNLEGAVSNDGARVYWTSGGSNGQLFLRLHPEQGIVPGEYTGGKCSDPATVACTLEVSGGNQAFFWQASPDGSKALYSEGELGASTAKLYEFDLAREEAEEDPRRLVAEEVRGVAGASRDLSRVYFTSRTALPGVNSEGDEAVAGEPNLYLADGTALEFVATLVEGDVGAKEPGAAANLESYNVSGVFPVSRATRVSADGSRIAFQSRAPLTEYDNADAASGKPAVEVYVYVAGGELVCVSCNPSRSRPATREMSPPYGGDPEKQPFHTLVRSASWIPGWEHSLHASNVLSKDGNRLFFNSNDALLPRDGNGSQDVYEWEAPGMGSCEEGDADYFAQNGGCLYLISSGLSPRESEFWEASADGRDVFFTTSSSLVPQDAGSIDLYDARAGGGFPPPARTAECEGEACQSPPAPPQFQTPASGAYRGPGNVAPRRRCRAAKAKRGHRRPSKAKRCRRANRRAGR